MGRYYINYEKNKKDISNVKQAEKTDSIFNNANVYIDFCQLFKFGKDNGNALCSNSGQ